MVDYEGEHWVHGGGACDMECEMNDNIRLLRFC